MCKDKQLFSICLFVIFEEENRYHQNLFQQPQVKLKKLNKESFIISFFSQSLDNNVTIK